MKRLLLILGVWFAMFDCLAQNVDSLLSVAYSRDQDVRLQMVELVRAVTVDGKTELIDSLLAAQTKMNVIDDENMQLVEEIVADGMPKNLSQSSYNAIWLIIDHADISKQERYLPMIEQAMHEGLVAPSKYATLYDRIEMKHNRPQRYGTQAYQTNNSGTMIVYIWPAESYQDLDSLRKQMGIVPINEQIEALRVTSGADVVFEPELTVEQILTQSK